MLHSYVILNMHVNPTSTVNTIINFYPKASLCYVLKHDKRHSNVSLG